MTQGRTVYPSEGRVDEIEIPDGGAMKDKGKTPEALAQRGAIMQDAREGIITDLTGDEDDDGVAIRGRD